MIEALEYNLLFRWFLDFNLMDPVWDLNNCSKSQERLLAHQGAALFCARVGDEAGEPRTLIRWRGWREAERVRLV